jgi:hypothetical protein
MKKILASGHLVCAYLSGKKKKEIFSYFKFSITVGAA